MTESGDPQGRPVSEDHLATQPLPTLKGATPPEDATTLALSVKPPFPEARPEEAVPHVPRKRFWVLGILAVAILGGSLGYYFLSAPGESPAPAPARPEDAPAVLRPYLDLAAQGDASAMRMLGTMYYNGLNVPQDRREGVKWYRKAAAAGNVAAKRDLEQLGLAQEEKK